MTFYHQVFQLFDFFVLSFDMKHFGFYNIQCLIDTAVSLLFPGLSNLLPVGYFLFEKTIWEMKTFRTNQYTQKLNLLRKFHFHFDSECYFHLSEGQTLPLTMSWMQPNIHNTYWVRKKKNMKKKRCQDEKELDSNFLY